MVGDYIQKGIFLHSEVMTNVLRIGLIVDPAPLEFFTVRIMNYIAPSFNYTNMRLERDMDSLFNEKILTIEFEHQWSYARLMHLLSNKPFVM